MTVSVRPARLDDLGYELVDLRAGGTPKRCLIRLRIDCPPSNPENRLTIEDCALVSRALEAWLDADLPLGPHYVLEVSSPGMERPLRWPEQWQRFIGRDVNVRAEGLGRVRATIVAVPDAAHVVLELKGSAPQEIAFDRIEDATLAVDW